MQIQICETGRKLWSMFTFSGVDDKDKILTKYSTIFDRHRILNDFHSGNEVC